MSEEEKKAIEYLTSLKYLKYGDYADKIDLIINLINKQQKEIELLKEEQAQRSWVHIKENGEVEPLFYISKDKIREKIKELEELKEKYFEKQIIQGRIDLLNELLEE